MTGTRTQPGLTLVELLVAMVLTTLVAGATGAVLRTVWAARERVETQMALQQEARAAADAVAAALRNACWSEADTLLLEGIDQTHGDLPADRIRFFTRSRRPVRPGQPESELRECELFCEDPTQAGPDRLPALLRRLDPTRNQAPDGGGVVERLAEGVIALDVRYHDGAEWLPEWPVTRRSWPVAIHVEIVLVSRTRPPALLSVARTVSFPHWPDIASAARAGGAGNTPGASLDRPGRQGAP